MLGRAGQMRVKCKDSSCCAGWDFVDPGTCKVARLDGKEGMKMHLANFFFLSLSFHVIFLF